MQRPDNIPLPNLSTAAKLMSTVVLLAGAFSFLGTWFFVLRSVYMGDTGSIFGIELGALAALHPETYYLLLTLHVAAMVLLIVASQALFNKTSIRRRVKKLLFGSAAILALLDASAWIYAPTCSSSNLYVGFVGVLAALPLVILALVPLWQIWIYRRWRSPNGELKRVVIVGGGFAGLYAALGLNRVLGYSRDLEITVIDRRNYFLFPPLLPSAAVGTIETRQVSFPFRRIFETTNILFRKVTVSSVDPIGRVVRGLIEVNTDPVTGEEMLREAEFPYDYLVLAPGSLSQTFNTPGAAEHAFFMRELNDAVLLRNHIIDCFERAATLADTKEQRELLHFVVVGAGPTGIETATEVHDLIHEVLLKRYPEIDAEIPQVSIVQSGEQVLPGWDAAVVRMTERQLERMKLKLLLRERVAAVGPRSVTLGQNKVIPTRTIVWCAGVRPNDLVARCGVELHRSGRVQVNEDLSVPGRPELFVLGDAAFLLDKKTGQPLPPLGQVAFQQGALMAKNLVRSLSGEATRPFRYFNFGGLVSVGEHFAAVNLLGIKFSGFIGWFIWRTLYLMKLVGLSNKIRVVIDWTLDLLIERSISQIRDAEAPKSRHVQKQLSDLTNANHPRAGQPSDGLISGSNVAVSP